MLQEATQHRVLASNYTTGNVNGAIVSNNVAPDVDGIVSSHSDGAANEGGKRRPGRPRKSSILL